MKFFPLIQESFEPKYGLIANPQPPYGDGDPGDTAHREGTFAALAAFLFLQNKISKEEFELIRTRYQSVVSLLNDEKHPGFLRRFADKAYWGGDSDRFSRDQAIPNIVAMGLLDKPSLTKFFKAHLKHLLLFTTNTRRNGTTKENHGTIFKYEPSFLKKLGLSSKDVPVKRNYNWKLPDFTLGAFHGSYIRSFGGPRFLLYLLDWDLVITALTKVYIYSKDKTNNDDINYILLQLQANLTPTPISNLAWKIYQKRPFPNNSKDATTPAQACFNAYFDYGPKLHLMFKEL